MFHLYIFSHWTCSVFHFFNNNSIIKHCSHIPSCTNNSVILETFNENMSFLSHYNCDWKQSISTTDFFSQFKHPSCHGVITKVESYLNKPLHHLAQCLGNANWQFVSTNFQSNYALPFLFPSGFSFSGSLPENHWEEWISSSSMGEIHNNGWRIRTETHLIHLIRCF